MQLSDIKKLSNYYENLVRTGNSLLINKRVDAQSFAIRGIISIVPYGTSFSEYAGYGFYTKSRKVKQTNMPQRHMFRFVDHYNPTNLWSRIGDKSLAVKYYSDFPEQRAIHKSKGMDEFIIFLSRHSSLLKKRWAWVAKERKSGSQV